MKNLEEINRQSFHFDKRSGSKLPWHIRDLNKNLLYKIFKLVVGCGDCHVAPKVRVFKIWIDQGILASFFKFNYNQSDCLVIERNVSFQHPIKLHLANNEGAAFLNICKISEDEVVNFQKMKFCHHIITTQSDLAVIWDRSISVKEIENIFAKADDFANKILWH